MGTFSLSSNPLSTLFPDLSPQQDPNYNNAFQVDFSSLRNNTSPMPDYAKQFAESAQPMLNQMKFKVGLLTSDSSDPTIAFNGNRMIDEVLDGMSQKTKQFSELFPVSGGQLPTKPNLFQKVGGWQTVGAAADMLGSFMPEKDEYSGARGDLTQSLDSAYDNISNTLMAIPGWGTVAGGIMKAGSLLGKGVNALGGGTDGMTSTDAILGSSFLSLTPFGLINGFGGKKADTITKNEQAFEVVGSSYTGTNQTVNEALTKSGKKYGLFSSRARRKANEEIAEARRQQEVMTDIADEATDRFAIRNSMAAISGNRRAYLLQGGYNQSSVRVGKTGMSIELLNRAKQIAKQAEKLQAGGAISDPFEVYLQSLPQAQRDSTNFRVRDYWEYNGRPKNFDEARKKGMFEWKEDFDQNGKSLGWSWHAFTVAKNPNADEYDFMKSSSHPTVQKEIDWYNSDAGSEFRREYELQKVQPYYKYVKRKAPYKDVPVHKEGGSIIELVSLPTEILLVDPTEIPEFQEGGQISKKSRTLQELIEYAKKENPRFIQRMSEPPRGIDFIDDNGNQVRGSHYMEWSTDDNGNAIVYPRIQEVDGELKFFNGPEAYKRAVENRNYLIMTPEEAKIFFAEDPKYGAAYKSGWPRFFNRFQQGGSINVIPDGALHARKHNMDMEGITKKGIPVVTENKDGSIEQQAEIEKEEIIFRLEVTKKLEELEKKFYDEGTSKEEKDQLALEAGKLLVEEILHNTIDNTNNLL